MRLRQSTRRRGWKLLSLLLVVLGSLLVGVSSAPGMEVQPASTLSFARGDYAGEAGESGGLRLAEVRQRAEAARKQLQQATAEYRQSQHRLERARHELRQTRRAARRVQARLRKASEPVKAMANAAYQHPPVSGFGTVLTSENPQATMRAAVDFAKLSYEQQAALRRMRQLLARKHALQASARDIAHQAQTNAAKLKKDRQALRQRSQRLTNDLIRAMQRIGLDASPGDRLPLGCNSEQVDVSAYPNGLIPRSALCPLPHQGHYLRSDAAQAFARINIAYARRFGEALCVTDTYRSLAEQQSLYASKPGIAAVPGTSTHGRGLAVDLCGGIEEFGTEQFQWMKNHARDYGWIHPDWATADGSNPEPWHWEYVEADS